MKTEIIRINQFDNISSIRDKLKWVKSPRVLVYFPDRINDSFSQVDLQILVRQAQRQGTQLALVSRSVILKERAEGLCLPIFNSTEDAYRQRWRVIKRKQTSPADNEATKKSIGELREQLIVHRSGDEIHQVIRLFAFLAGIASVITLVWFFIPRVEVIFDSDRQVQNYKMILQGKMSESGFEFVGVIPVHETVILVNSTDQRETSGMVSLPNTKATGEVILTNLTDQTVEIPKGTIISTLSDPPVKYSTSYDEVVEAGAGKTKAVMVEALEAGLSGNIQAGEIRVVQGKAGLLVAAHNETDFYGGVDAQVAAPSISDFDMLEQKILKTMALDAEEMTKNAMETGQLMLPGSIHLKQVIITNAFPSIGEPGDTLEMEIQAEYIAWYVEQEEMTSLGQMAMDALLPKEFRAADPSVSIEISPAPLQQNNLLTWQIQMTRIIEKDLQQAEIVHLISGRNPEIAAHLLQEKYLLASVPEIFLTPNWWRVLPFLSFQYKLVGK